MTDGCTIAGRDVRRVLLYDAFLDAVRDYVHDPREERLEQVRRAAEAIDAVPGCGGSFAPAIDETVRPLGAGDHVAWQAFLRDLADNRSSRFFEFADLAPFGRDNLE